MVPGLVLLAAVSLVVQGEVLRNFQVAQPPVVPKDTKQCTVQVLQRDFAFSYGQSEIVTLNPPTDCGEPGSWAAITLNFTVTSNGTQYDRLGIFSINKTEIWRTSTPEPTRGDGIIWTYLKDVSQYTPLFATSNTFILQLDNIIQTGLDGVYSTVVHATYYAASKHASTVKQSNQIISLSRLSDNDGGVISVPPAYNVTTTFPQNTVEVYAEIFASGNSREEFWFSNIVNEYMDDIPLADSIAYHNGPFREVQLALDGKLVGTVFPFVPIFTGGAAPPMWRPISAYGALELPTYHLDLTAFVPLLVDGLPHTFTLSVISAEPDYTTEQNWYLTANLQVITNSASTEPTTGNVTVYSIDPYPQMSTTGHVLNGGQDVDFTVTASRKVHVESTVVAGGSGKKNHVVWTQDLKYTNVQTFAQGGITQVVDQKSSGAIRSTQNGKRVVEDLYEYPLWMNLTYLGPDLRNWTVSVDHTYNRALHADPFTLGSKIASHQTADAFFQLQTGGNYGNGTNNNTFSYLDDKGNTYRRKVNAAYNVITLDEESGSLAPYPVTEKGAQGHGQDTFRFGGSGAGKVRGGGG